MSQCSQLIEIGFIPSLLCIQYSSESKNLCAPETRELTDISSFINFITHFHHKINADFLIPLFNH